jgi:hypothetical protein
MFPHRIDDSVGSVRFVYHWLTGSIGTDCELKLNITSVCIDCRCPLGIEIKEEIVVSVLIHSTDIFAQWRTGK